MTTCCQMLARLRPPGGGSKTLEGEATQAWIRTLRSHGADLLTSLCSDCLSQLWAEVGAGGMEELKLGKIPAYKSSPPVESQPWEETMPTVSLKEKALALAEAKIAHLRSAEAGKHDATMELVRLISSELSLPHKLKALSPPAAAAATGADAAAQRLASSRSRPLSAAVARMHPESGGQPPQGATPDGSRRQRQEDTKTASSRQRAADILTAMHERHIQLEANMHSASRTAQEEEAAMPANGINSIRHRSTLLRASKGREPEDTGVTVKILIKGAKNLRPGESRTGGTSDPFCVCMVPNHKHMRVQTQVARKTLNPSWNETFSMTNYTEGDPLVFRILDEIDEEILGQGTLVSSVFFGGFDGQVDLSTPPGKGRTPGITGELSVQVEVLFQS